MQGKKSSRILMSGIFLFQFRSQVVAAFVSHYSTESACRKLAESYCIRCYILPHCLHSYIPHTAHFNLFLLSTVNVSIHCVTCRIECLSQCWEVLHFFSCLQFGWSLEKKRKQKCLELREALPSPNLLHASACRVCRVQKNVIELDF